MYYNFTFINLLWSRLIGNLCDLVTLPWTFTALNFISVITFDLANASIQDHTKASPRQHTSTCIWCNSKQSDGLDGTKKPVPFLNSLRERLWCYKIDHRTMKIVYKQLLFNHIFKLFKQKVHILSKEKNPMRQSSRTCQPK